LAYYDEFIHSSTPEIGCIDILITKFRGIDLRSDFNYLDVEMNDIEDIIDYFSLYGKNE
jgi:hypothetical protein